MRHVALLVPGIERIAGAERQTILLAQGLLKRGWRVSVIALSLTGGVAAEELAADGIGFMSLGMRKGLADPRGWIRFRSWLRRETPDVVHAQLPHAAWFARWSRAITPMRVLIDTLHSSATGGFGRRLGYRWSSWLPNQVTAVSYAVAERHLAAGMVNERRLLVLPNGVDTDLWRPDLHVRAARRRALHLDGAFLWLAAGRLDAVKNYPLLLRAFAMLPQETRLVIAGAGPLEHALRSLAEELGIAGRVMFLGFEPDVRSWMQAADGLLLTSHHEGLPMSLLEAAACELPTIATDVAGTNEVIKHGRTGLLAAPGDADALQQAMMALMTMSVDEREAMGATARAMALERFSLATALDRWESLYNEELRHSPQATRLPQRSARATSAVQ